MKFKHPAELWADHDFMEEVHNIAKIKWAETPEHCTNLCAFMAQAHELANQHIFMGADPHETTYLTFAHLFALGYEAALHNLATREHEV